MMPVTTEHLLVDVDAFAFDRVLERLALGVLAGCAVALILCFLVITSSDDRQASARPQESRPKSLSLLAHPASTGDLAIAPDTTR